MASQMVATQPQLSPCWNQCRGRWRSKMPGRSICCMSAKSTTKSSMRSRCTEQFFFHASQYAREFHFCLSSYANGELYHHPLFFSPPFFFLSNRLFERHIDGPSYMPRCVLRRPSHIDYKRWNLPGATGRKFACTDQQAHRCWYPKLEISENRLAPEMRVVDRTGR